MNLKEKIDADIEYKRREILLMVSDVDRDLKTLAERIEKRQSLPLTSGGSLMGASTLHRLDAEVARLAVLYEFQRYADQAEVKP